MKNSQLYLLLGGMCFVGSLLTSKLSNSLLLFFMFFFWNFSALYIMRKESELEKFERSIERMKDEMIFSVLENENRKLKKNAKKH